LSMSRPYLALAEIALYLALATSIALWATVA
jgi:hypothetical protein